MKINLLYLFIIFHFFISSCETADYTEGKLQSTLKSISIPISDSYLNSYHILHAYQQGEVNKLVAYNDQTHALNFFDLDAEKVLEEIPLVRDGPKAIGKISSIYFHNPDSIFLFERGKLHIADFNGELVSSFSLYELFDIGTMGEPNLNYYFKLNYNSDTKSVLFYLTNPAITNELGEVSKIGVLYLETKKVKLLPIHHTDYFKSIDGKVGFLTYLGFHDYFDGQILYNFQYESSLFLHDLKSGKSKYSSGTLKEKSSYIKPLSSTEDAEVFDKHALESTHYLSVIPDKWRGMIYRFKWQRPNQEFENASWTEKTTSISIFDENLNYLMDYPLPDHTYQINNWFVNENGLYLDYAHPKNENQKEDFLIYHVIKFKK